MIDPIVVVMRARVLSFPNLAPGDYTVTEETRADWVASSATSIDSTSCPGKTKRTTTSSTTVRPARAATSMRTWTAAARLDGRRPASGKLGDHVDRHQRWRNAVDPIIITGADGSYEFPNLVPGNYTVTEAMRADWVTSSATSIDFDLVSGEDETDNDFLNYRHGQQSGHKYEDVDGSGTTGRRRPPSGKLGDHVDRHQR